MTQGMDSAHSLTGTKLNSLGGLSPFYTSLVTQTSAGWFCKLLRHFIAFALFTVFKAKEEARNSKCLHSLAKDISIDCLTLLLSLACPVLSMQMGWQKPRAIHLRHKSHNHCSWLAWWSISWYPPF